MLMQPVRAFCLVLLLCVCALACSTNEGTSKTASSKAASQEAALAKVNGVAISPTDLRFEAQGSKHEGADAAPDLLASLESVINKELAAQEALKTGLDADPDFQKALAEMEAQLNAYKRGRLAELYFKKAAAAAGRAIDDAAAKKYFEENPTRMRTEYHIMQLLVRNENQANVLQLSLTKGKPFEEVAKEHFAAVLPNLKNAERMPWDLGYLRWNQIPDAWEDTLRQLKPGEISNVIKGPKNRFWLIQLVDKRENPEIDFESQKAVIIEYLKQNQTGVLNLELANKLREKAKIEYSAEKK